MKTIDVLKELSANMTELFSKVADRLSRAEKTVDAMSEEFKKSLQEVKDAIPDPSEPYDDSELQEKLIQIKKSMSEMKDEFVPSETLDEKLGALKEYDDSALIEKMEEISKALEDTSKRVTYEMPVPVPFDGEPLNKGAFVMWNNSLWLNKMEDNSSVPGVKNHSFMQIIVAPREITHKGLYKEDEDYEFNDIVMKDNASWIRVKGKSNELPGEGWKLLAKGIKGRKGDKGDPGKSEIIETDQTKAIEHLQDEIFILKGKEDAKDTK